MFPADFAYARAASVDDALDLLAEAQVAGDEAKLIAGGQSLLPMMKLRLAAPQLLIDIADIEDLKGITIGEAPATVGALTTYRALQCDGDLTGRHPAMADALAVLADQQVRARGTVGGAVAHGDPAADLPAVLLALDAIVEITARGGTRSTPLDDFLRGIFTTDLAEDEIVTAITIPEPARRGGHGEAYVKFAHPASHLPLAGVCAVVTVDNGIIASAQVAVTGVAGRPFRTPDVGRALVSRPPHDRLIEQAASQVATGITPLSDQHASGPYRLHLAEVLTRRALSAAVRRALNATQEARP